MQTFERFLTQPEERKLFKHVRQFACVLARRDDAWMRLARNTGIRVGAMAGLTVLDARKALASGYLTLRSEIQKRKRAHTMHLNKAAAKALRDLLKIRREMGHAEADDAVLIVSRNHRGLSVRSFQARMRQWSEGAGLPLNVTPHWWRHTLGMRLMRNSTAQDPRGVVQGVLGHSRVDSTMVYTRPSREDLANALDEVAA